LRGDLEKAKAQKRKRQKRGGERERERERERKKLKWFRFLCFFFFATLKQGGKYKLTRKGLKAMDYRGAAAGRAG
jgi:hypothetical protein